MPDAALVRLLSWLSPAFPVGSFAYSHGIEQAIHAGLIRDRVSLIDWLTTLLERGSAWNDAVLLAEAWRQTSAGSDCAEIAELAEAMAGSRERHMETTLQGAAFGEAVSAWDLDHPLTGPSGHLSPSKGERRHGADARANPAWVPRSLEGGEVARRADEGVASTWFVTTYPIAVAIAAARHRIPPGDTLAAYLHAFTSNLIQAAVRLIPLGQRDGVATLAALEPVILDVTTRATGSTLDDLGSSAMVSDIMSMQHETLYSRVFRS